MRFTRWILVAGLAVAGLGGTASAHPYRRVVVEAPVIAPPVIVERPVITRGAIVRDGWYGRRWYGRSYRVRERGWGRTARSYRRGSRW